MSNEFDNTNTPTDTSVDTKSNEGKDSPAIPSVPNDQPSTLPKIPKDKGAEASKNNEPIADFDYSKYETEFLQTGDINETSRNELYKHFPKNLVDNYIENLKVANTYNVSQAQNQAYEIVGGVDRYKDMITWASANLTPEEIEDFNEALGGNQRQALQAIRGLNAIYSLNTKSNKPSIVMGGANISNVSDDVFLTRKDYALAVADDNYQKSPQYRASIDAKLAKTLKLGGFKG